MNKTPIDSSNRSSKALDKGFKFNYKLLLTLIAGLAPVAYLVGYSFYQGILAAFGVSSDMFGISTYMTYVYSYLAVGSFFLEVLSFSLNCLTMLLQHPLIFLSVVVIVVLGLWIYKKIKKRKQSKKTNSKVKIVATELILVWSKNEIVKSGLIGGFASYLLCLILSVLMAVSILWWALPLAAHQLGYYDSLEKIQNYDDDGCCQTTKNGFSICTSLVNSDNQELISGLMVASTSKLIAFYNHEGSTVQEFPSGAKLKSMKVEESCNN